MTEIYSGSPYVLKNLAAGSGQIYCPLFTGAWPWREALFAPRAGADRFSGKMPPRRPGGQACLRPSGGGRPGGGALGCLLVYSPAGVGEGLEYLVVQRAQFGAGRVEDDSLAEADDLGHRFTGDLDFVVNDRHARDPSRFMMGYGDAGITLGYGSSAGLAQALIRIKKRKYLLVNQGQRSRARAILQIGTAGLAAPGHG